MWEAGQQDVHCNPFNSSAPPVSQRTKRTALWGCVCVCESGKRPKVYLVCGCRHHGSQEASGGNGAWQAPHQSASTTPWSRPPTPRPRLLPSGHTWQRGHPAPSKRDWETRDTNKRLDTFSYSDLMVWNFALFAPYLCREGRNNVIDLGSVRRLWDFFPPALREEQLNC